MGLVRSIRRRLRRLAVFLKSLFPSRDDYDGPERRRRGLTWERVALLIALALAGWSTLGVASDSEETAQLVRENAQLVRKTARLSKENAARIREVAALTRRIVLEGRRRRDQSCKQDETLYRRDVKGIRRTYAYLDRLPREEYGTNLTEEIVRGLPDQRAEAKANRPPPFCNEPGIGLGARPPKLPPPRDFSRLLIRP